MSKLNNISQTNHTASDKENAASYREACFNTLLDFKFDFFKDTSLAERVWANVILLKTYPSRRKPIFTKEQLEEISITSKLKNKTDENLSVSAYDATTDTTSKLLETTDDYYDDFYEEEEYAQVKIDALYTASTKELIRRLALYTGQVQATLFRVLRNTRIHSLSIFFGLCCSRSGYIFEAITGSSSHPIPASL